jgi:hypothetical protein
MTSTTRLIAFVFLMAMTMTSHAGTTTVIRVTARIVHHCTATATMLADCSKQTLRFQSTLRGSAKVIATESEPSVHFIGPRPVLEKTRNRLNILF